ncbi:iron-sulfur cluster carrier protein ApbC [Arsukibacterium sp.]|uniref:iron-sulfur cluster carrier protein ApbC n=1 Tax=Arsukibacterium sp. TaxID=1977258 RepID=UPI00299E43E8|nr:iron-sulfur cluster carrier protein ApbC [Arsukibacterium sp.]MDX1676651.1 iron-sulfur cluster carrier protein ApbC [Arsukibacterium sp.]
MFNWLKKTAKPAKNHHKPPVSDEPSTAEREALVGLLRSSEPVMANIQHIVLVASGKGGVGKSTTAVNLAVMLAKLGLRTGLLDADIYGPSVPMMLGLQGARADSPDNKLLNPKQAFGISLQSIGFLIEPEKASVWRGPMASQALLQLINETLWPALDILIVDMPPGTGDIQLTLSQKLKVSGAVIVTTPQDVALSDAGKAITMFNQVKIPVLGLIENMSYYLCPQCGYSDDIFGTAGGVRLAGHYQVPVLGQLPLERQIREHADQGTPAVLKLQPIDEIYRTIAWSMLANITGATAQQVEIIITDD